MKHRLLVTAFISVALMAIIHVIASKFILYWTVGWFDNVVHFMGGFSTGLFALWIYYLSGIFHPNVPTKKQIIIKSFLFVLVIGVGWEIFEYMNGLTQSTEGYPLDTFHDLVSDLAGALIAGDVASYKKFYITSIN
jgi:hypothetical protein